MRPEFRKRICAGDRHGHAPAHCAPAHLDGAAQQHAGQHGEGHRAAELVVAANRHAQKLHAAGAGPRERWRERPGGRAGAHLDLASSTVNEPMSPATQGYANDR